MINFCPFYVSFLKSNCPFLPTCSTPWIRFLLVKTTFIFPAIFFYFILRCLTYVHDDHTTSLPILLLPIFRFVIVPLSSFESNSLFQSTIANFFDKLTIHNRPQVRVNKDSSHLNYPRTENISSSLTIKWNEDPIFVVVRVTKYRKSRLLYPCRGDRS